MCTDKRVRGMQVVWAGEQGHLCIYLCSLITVRAWWRGRMRRVLVETRIPNSTPSQWYYAGGEQVPVWFQRVMFGQRWGLVLFNSIWNSLTGRIRFAPEQTGNGRDLILHLVRSAQWFIGTNTAATTDMATAEQPPSLCLFPSSHPHLDIPPPLGGHLVPNQACPLQHSSPPAILSTLLSGVGGIHSDTRIQVIRHRLPIWARALSRD